jgi:hypothetical protein
MERLTATEWQDWLDYWSTEPWRQWHNLTPAVDGNEAIAFLREYKRGKEDD